MTLTAKTVQSELRKYVTREKAEFLPYFFKTGEGQYGAGDKFIGVTVPNSRKVALQFKIIDLAEVEILLASEIHEDRLVGLLILVSKFEKGDTKIKKEIYDFYLKNINAVNNWDLVDLSAHKIMGAYLLDKDQAILTKLSKSTNLWERRIAIIATYWFIKNHSFAKTYELAEILLQDKEDLIQKAVGWMLREAGKRDLLSEKAFLRKHYKAMPRTMLRYAIEKFPEVERQKYLMGKI